MLEDSKVTWSPLSLSHAIPPPPNGWINPRFANEQRYARAKTTSLFHSRTLSIHLKSDSRLLSMILYATTDRVDALSIIVTGTMHTLLTSGPVGAVIWFTSR